MIAFVKGMGDVSNFIHSIKNNEHCILMFDNEDTRDKIIQEFFNPKFTRNVTLHVFHKNHQNLTVNMRLHMINQSKMKN